jgi:MFS superfamily sulfate permease-like transporter
MAFVLWDLLTWQHKESSAMVFLSLNLFFYLIVLCDYSVVSILSFVAVAFILAANLHAVLSSRPEQADDDYEYVTREQLESVFVTVFELGKTVTDHVQQSTGNRVQLILALLLGKWLLELFGTPGLLWLATVAGFLIAPQYRKQSKMIDEQVKQLVEKAKDAQQTVMQIIPKHSHTD